MGNEISSIGKGGKCLKEAPKRSERVKITPEKTFEVNMKRIMGELEEGEAPSEEYRSKMQKAEAAYRSLHERG